MSGINQASSENIALDKIVIEDGFNVRKEVGDVTGLTASIKSMGVQTPIGLHKQARGGKYTLVYGFRRFAAATAAGLAEIPARVYDSKVARKDLLLLNLQENVVRQSLNPMEEANGANRLVNEGMTEDEVIDALGWSKTILTQRLSLLEYPEGLRNAIANDEVTVAQARAISALPEDKQGRFVDMAKGLKLDKLREAVDKEIEKANAANNATPVTTGEGDAPTGEAQGEAESTTEKVNPAALATSIIGSLSDIAAFGHSQDDEQGAKAIIVIKSIDWTNLSADDLQALDGCLDLLAKALGCQGFANPDESADPV